MANDPANSPANGSLALSGIAAGPPREAEYRAVYAAVTATERGRWFLTEFANRNRHADTGSLVAALARIEAAVGIDARSNDTAAASSPAAAEKIRDIAFTLRERGGDPALCDALEAAAREIGAVLPEAADGPARTAPADPDEVAISGDTSSSATDGAEGGSAENGNASAADFEFELQDREK